MIDVMVTAYLECALWTERDESDEPFSNNFTIDDFSQETKDKAKEDCEYFLSLAKDFLPQGADLGQVGQDFWLTRNQYGTGFWENIAHEFYPCGIVNDNGLLHIV